jgi:type VI secretion system protein ImpJ
MRQLQPVLWTKGVLLSPQHLQTQDRFLEDSLHFQLSSLAFAPWGFARVAFDREALAGGTLAITEASGLLPDGLAFDMPNADAPPPPRQLEGSFEGDRTSLDVYLAIPEYRYGGHNVSSAQRDRATRFRVDELLRRDENTGLGERPIQIARKNFRLLLEGEALEGHILLRAGRIVRSSAGAYQLDLRFVPPLVDLAGSEHLLSIARRLVEITAAKSTELAGRRRQKNLSLAEFGIGDVASFWLLFTVNTYFPLLRHVYETRRGHPAGLYEVMLSLAGALTTFSAEIHPRQLPAYQHDELGPCFDALDDMLRQLLETVVPTNYVTLPLRLHQPSVWITALEQDRYLSATHVYLAVSCEGRRADLSLRGPGVIKISSAAQIDHLIRQALPGVTMTHVPVPPSTIPVKLDHQYFLLQKSGNDWEAIVRARNVAVYVPAEFPDPQLELVLVLPAKSGARD